ncbi:MAG: FHA domain-containing protein [Pseudomonadota bacterium]
MDQSKKTMRHFYCRDVLWETFEQMANDFDCSIDYLVNEAMRYYARSKNYHSAQTTGSGVAGEPRAPRKTAAFQTPASAVPSPVSSAAPASVSAPSPAPAPAPAATGVKSSAASTTQPPTPPSSVSGPIRRAVPPQPPQPPPGSPARSPTRPAMPTTPIPAVQPPPAAVTTPDGAVASPAPRRPGPPPPRPTTAEQNVSGPAPTLFLIYDNQRYPIEKDQFIIGRGSKTSDLAIKDGNISRKHVAVIRRNGTYYIKDLGSTNGIDYKGVRIDNKRIDEGDTFHLCDYELRFTYRS